MAMTKQDFIALADDIANWNRRNLDQPFTDNHIRVLASFCSGQNSAFNRDRWIDFIAGRVGPNGGKKGGR